MKALLIAALVLSSAASQAQTIGAWEFVEKIGEDAAVISSNDSGEHLVKYCRTESQECFWAVVSDRPCDKGTSYPALLNSEVGTATIEMACMDSVKLGKGGEKWRLVLIEHDTIERAARSETMLGIAYGLQESKFGVMRFKTNGAKIAIDAMERKVMDRNKTSTKSQVL